MSMRRPTHTLLLALLLLVCAPFSVAAAQEAPVPDDQIEQEEGRACADSEEDGCEEREAEGEDVPADGEEPTASTARRRHTDSSVPKVTKLRVRSVRGGKRISYNLSEKADVTILFEKCTVRRGAKCIHWSRTGPKLLPHGRKGANSAFVSSKRLPRGKYVVEIHAVDGGHHHSNVAHTVFSMI